VKLIAKVVINKNTLSPKTISLLDTYGDTTEYDIGKALIDGEGENGYYFSPLNEDTDLILYMDTSVPLVDCLTNDITDHVERETIKWKRHRKINDMLNG
jgi:hypothetical protein